MSPWALTALGAFMARRASRRKFHVRAALANAPRPHILRAVPGAASFIGRDFSGAQGSAMKAQTAAALCAAFLLCGCFEDTGTNKGCTSYCFSFNGIENEKPAELEAKIKQACEKMGRHGKPEVKEQSKSAVAGYCPE